MVFIPLIIPPHVNAVAWIHLLGTKGWVNLMTEKLFSAGGPLFSIYGMKGAVLLLSLSYFPIVTILTMSGLSAADRRLEEAGRLITTDFHVLRKVTLPLIMIYTVMHYGAGNLTACLCLILIIITIIPVLHLRHSCEWQPSLFHVLRSEKGERGYCATAFHFPAM